jgi:hypothetical protein
MATVRAIEVLTCRMVHVARCTGCRSWLSARCMLHAVCRMLHLPCCTSRVAGWRPGDGSAGFRPRWRTPAHTSTGTGAATSVLGLGSPQPTSAPGLRRCIPDDSRAAASDGRTPKQTRRIVRCARFECGLLARASSAPGLGSPRPYLHRDWARSLPHLHQDWARSSPHLLRCGRDEPSPCSDGAGASPSPGADVAGGEPGL